MGQPATESSRARWSAAAAWAQPREPGTWAPCMQAWGKGRPAVRAGVGFRVGYINPFLVGVGYCESCSAAATLELQSGSSFSLFEIFKISNIFCCLGTTKGARGTSTLHA